jgi:hypothetical protein
MTLLSIIQEAAQRLLVQRPTEVVSSEDKTATRLLALAQEEGRSLNRHAAWKKLQREWTFTTTAAEAQTTGLATDLDWIIPETIFDRTLKRPVEGPLSPQEWQSIESNLITRVWPAYRIRGTSMLLSPVPVAGKTIAYEYITQNWCLSSVGVEQSSWAADTDTPILDSELHILGIVWRFKFRSGFDFSDDLQIYEAEKTRAIMREGVRPRLSSDGPWKNRHGADAIAGARPDIILTEGGDAIGWD